MRKNLLLLVALFSFTAISYAQDHKHGNWCKTDEVYNKAYNEDPATFKAIERQLDEAVVAYSNTASKMDDGRTFYIPVVFHYVHPVSQEGERFFTRAMAEATVRRLNEDFNRNNFDSFQIQTYYKFWRRGNARIKFVIAQIDPDGEATNGVNYYATDLAETANRNGNDDIIKYHTYSVGKFWSPDNYLNFWCVESISQPAGTQGEILAYATLPEFEAFGATRKTQSGVIAKRAVFMENITGKFQRHTLSHEVGHWLGLRHPFQTDEKSIQELNEETQEYEPTGCNEGDCKFKGDKICDIPQAYGQFLACSANINSCPNETPIDNTTNIMDYRNCPEMFSRDQCIRMRGTLLSFRTEIVSWENLQRVGINDKIVTDIKGKTSVYPNPFSDKIIVEVEMQRDVTACIEIRDLLGRSAYKDCKKKLHAGINKVEINANDMNLSSNGVYLVEIKMEDAVIVHKLQYNGK
ncbi:MAG: M43 family zinc metalloprotease [Bacteroidia bacterium]